MKPIKLLKKRVVIISLIIFLILIPTVSAEVTLEVTPKKALVGTPATIIIKLSKREFIYIFKADFKVTDPNGKVSTFTIDVGVGNVDDIKWTYPSNDFSPPGNVNTPGIYIVEIKYRSNPKDKNPVTLTEKFERDKHNTRVKIKRPVPGHLYIFDIETFSFPHTTLVGCTTIEADAEAYLGIDRVEFYIDNELRSEDSYQPYRWKWNQNSIFKIHTLEIFAIDILGNKASEEIEILKII